MHNVDVVAILLDQNIARVLAIEEPVADELLGRIVADCIGGPPPSQDARTILIAPSSPGCIQCSRSAVVLSVTLLEVHRDALRRIRFLRRRQETAYACGIHSRGLFAEECLRDLIAASKCSG